MITAVEDRIQNPQFKNWVKSALSLDFARDALKEFVETKNKTNHESLVKGIPVACSSCDFNTCATCQNKNCTNEHIKTHITISHCQPKPSFCNTTPKDCWSHPWEFAKCFMPQNGYKGIKSAEETDFLGLVSVVVNNWDFRAAISNNDSKFIKARDIRNGIMHNPGFEVDDQTFKDYIDVINEMLISIQMTEKTKTALSSIDELCRGTLTISGDDIARVINESIATLKLRKDEIKDSIHEMSKLSERCTRTIKEEAKDGVKTIKHQTEECVEILSCKTKEGLEDIKKETEEATDQLNVKKEEGFNALASQAIEKASQLQILHKDNTVALQETAERERDAIKKKGEQEIVEIQREKKMLECIMKDGIKNLDSDINMIRKQTIQTENVRDEISQNAGKIQQTTSRCMTTVRDITKVCLESLHKETATFRSCIRDSKSQSELEQRNDIENIRTEFRAEIQEVFREIRDLKSEKEDTRARMEIISHETERLITFIDNFNSNTELDIPIDNEHTHMALIGIKLEEDRDIRDESSRQEDIISRIESISQGTEKLATTKGDSNSSLEDDTPYDIEDTHMEISWIKQKEERVTRHGKSGPEDVISHMESISEETENITTIEGDSNSSPEDDTPNDFGDTHMEVSGIKQEAERVTRDGKSRRLRVLDHLDIQLDSDKRRSHIEAIVKLKVLDHLDIQLDSDKRRSHIKAIVKVGVDKLAVVDYNNDRVKIINVRSNTITSFVDVNHPMDITYVNDNLLVVACSRVLQFLELKNDKLSVQKKRFDFNDREHRALGVDYTHVDKLFAVYLLPDVVRFIDLEGNTLREIKIKLNICSFHYANITISNDGKRLYVIDETEYSVLCMDIRDGTTLHRYKQGKLHPPVGLAEDTVGNVYIAEKKSRNIHIFSPDGSHMSILLDEVNGIEYQSAITYCDQEHALYVCYQARGKEYVSIHPLKHEHK